MPIEVDSEIRIFSQDEFHSMARRFMAVVFDLHNQMGRLMDEEIYKRAIQERAANAGLVGARREVEIKVRFNDFQKSYFMDLLFGGGLMVETKAAERLSKAHQAQTLHYLLLAGLRNGLLINLRPNEVQKRFVSTTLDLAERRRFIVHDSAWRPMNDASDKLRQLFLELLADWGAFLQASLYREAIIHFFGGTSIAVRRIPIYDGDAVVGTQETCLIADDSALALTMLKDGKSKMKQHLQKFLCHTRLTCLQWINVENHDVEFTTLAN